ncbi:MAG: MlaD family protein [Rikenellaceae bacterium]
MKREVKIGLFAICMIAFGWWGVKFLSGYDLFASNNTYYAAYDKSYGLKQAAPVMMYGVKVGSVTNIKISQQRGKVIATLKIDKGYRIPEDSRAKVFSPGIMSAQAIDIMEGNSMTTLANRDTIATVQDVGLVEMALSEVDFFKVQFSTIAEDLSRTLNNVNLLLESNSENINTTVDNLSVLSKQLSQLIESQESNIATTMDGVSAIAQSLGDNSGQIDSIVTNVNQFTAELTRLQLATTVAQLNEVLTALNSGGGTANLFMQDERLYESLVSSVGSLDSLLVDLNENPKRYVHFSLFGARNKE